MATTTLLLEVPGLYERPAIGTSCCVTSAEALVAQELWMLPGVDEAEIDAGAGRVLVTYDSAAVSADQIAEATAPIGGAPVSPRSRVDDDADARHQLWLARLRRRPPGSGLMSGAAPTERRPPGSLGGWRRAVRRRPGCPDRGWRGRWR